MHSGLEKVRVEEARRLENLVLALAIVLMILAVIGQRGEKLNQKAEAWYTPH